MTEPSPGEVATAQNDESLQAAGESPRGGDDADTDLEALADEEPRFRDHHREDDDDDDEN